MQSKITYRQQYTHCGKQRCRKCRDGVGHGPYWYAYWNEKGRTVSKYIGTTLPPEIAAERATASIAPTFVLRVYLFGQFRIERKVKNEWQMVDNSTLKRRRARMLLGCLLSSPTRRLGREQAMEQLWPELDSDIAANRLNGAVHELRQILEPELAQPATSRMLKVKNDILELASNSLLWVDVEEFENLIKQVDKLSPDTCPQQIEQLLVDADQLYCDGYLLEEMYANWAMFRRDALQRRWIGILLQLADLRIQRGAFTSAVETLDRLRATEPTNEAALQKLMRLLARINRRGEALHIYSQYIAMLRREHETNPLQETQALYAELCGETAALVDPTILQSQHKAFRSRENTSMMQEARPSTFFTRPVFQSRRQNQSTLIGRENEKAEMSRLLNDIASQSSKRPHFLLLSGQSGIGKTRLAEELSEEADASDWAVVWNRAYEQESNVAYHVWMNISRTLIQCLKYPPVAQQDPLFSTYSYADMFSNHIQIDRRSTPSPGISTETSTSQAWVFPTLEQDRHYLREAVVSFIAELSIKHPMLIVLDDLQWADESSIELLTYLVHHLQERRVLIVGTYRESELQPTHKLQALIYELQSRKELVALKVQPLSDEHIKELVSRHSKQTIERIQKLSVGNPFFAEELARSAETQTESNLELRSLPDTISALLERRLRRLSKECQTILSRAAVLGSSFNLHSLLPMNNDYSEEAILDLLEEALNERLITEAREGAQVVYHFWHPLIYNHLYEHLSAARRIQLHRRAAEVIKSSQVEASLSQTPAQIALHLFKSGGDAKEIVYYAELAGNQAYAIAAYPEAQYSYVQALLALVGLTGTENPSNSELITRISKTLSDHSVAIQEDEPAISHLLELAAECSFHLGSFADARVLYTHALELRAKDTERKCSDASFMHRIHLQRQEAQIQALIWREIVFTYIAVGDYDLAQEGCKKGNAVLSQVGETDCIAWASIQLAISEIFRCKGMYNEAIHEAVQGLAMLEAIILPPVTTASPVNVQHHEKEMLAHVTHTPQHRQTKTEQTLHRDREILAYANEQLGVIKGSIGHIEEAINHMKLALQEYDNLKRTSEIARVCGNLGAAFISKSAFKEAKEYLDRAFSLAEHSGNRSNIAFIVGNLGDLANYTGNLLEAERYYKESIVMAEQINDREHLSWHHVLLADVQQDLGEFSESATNLLYALRIGRAIKNSRCIHFALVSLGELRLIEAIIEEQKPQADDESRRQSHTKAQKFLRRAKYTLNHALAQSGVEIDTIFECNLLLAITHLLSHDLEISQQIAQRTLEEAQKKNIARMAARAKRVLAGILSEQGKYDEAEIYLEDALNAFNELNIRMDQARTLRLYGSVLLMRSSAGKTSEVLSQENIDNYYQRGMNYLLQSRTITQDLHAAFDRNWSEYLIKIYSLENLGKEDIAQEALEYEWILLANPC